MNVICKEVFKQGKHVILPGEVCQAIFSENATVDLYWRCKKIARLPKNKFEKSFSVSRV